MHKKYQDLIFKFKYVCMSCSVNEDMYDENDFKKIKLTLSSVTKSIYIDKSYVEFPLNKHEKTYMTLKGWNEICKLVILTGYGKYCNKTQYVTLQEAFKQMILYYVYLLFEDLGYDIEGLYFEVDNDMFMVEYEIDSNSAWKSYLGKWQNWEKS